MNLIAGAGTLWEEATRSPFLDAAANGTLPGEAFRRWLAQDYLFAKGLTAFQAIVAAKIPRTCHKPVIAGLGALDSEMDWFEAHAARLGVNLDAEPHPTCRRYIDYLMRSAYTLPYQVLLAILYGVEASYQAAWSAYPAAGPYAEFFERWSNPAFAAYVAGLKKLVDENPHEAVQQHFNTVLEHERDFWKMSWEG